MAKRPPTAKEKRLKVAKRKRAHARQVVSQNSNIKRRAPSKQSRATSAKAIDELVGAVETGSAVASTSLLDPRSIADLLKRPVAASCAPPTEGDNDAAPTQKRPKVELSAEKLAELSESIDVDAQCAHTTTAGATENKNHFRRKGVSYAFWKRHGVNEGLLKALQDQHFTHPTPIQEKVLPYALDAPKKDIVVSAETGSGKTLVFALPTLHALLHQLETAPVPEADRTLFALVLTPTRELALQTQACYSALCKHVPARVSCVVGGMAEERQQRIINKRPHILICTPGRVWDLCVKNEGCFLGHSLSRRLRFLVLDEADRLLQSGRFQELRQLIERIHCDVLPGGAGIMLTPGGVADPQTALEEDDEDGQIEEGEWDAEKGEFVPKPKGDKAAVVIAAPAHAKDRPVPIKAPPAPDPNHRVQTFLTSATLTLTVNFQNKNIKQRKLLQTSNANVLGRVLQDLGMKEKSCELFNLAGDEGQGPSVVESIRETMLRCPENTKELYLYYFLENHMRRTIIFVNAISMVRRLENLLGVLGLPVYKLHASMQQRARLKSIDRFRASERAILLATDIASRGLDLPEVHHVIHYQLPRSTDAYIHRCGRTARCGSTGFSCLFVGADEFVGFQQLFKSMDRPTSSIEPFSIDETRVHKIRPHLAVALQIDKLEKEVGKTAADQHWAKRMSELAEVDDSDLVNENLEQENREKKKAIKVLKHRLATMQLQSSTAASGARGAFRSAATTVGASSAVEKRKKRAAQQLRQQ